MESKSLNLQYKYFSVKFQKDVGLKPGLLGNI